MTQETINQVLKFRDDRNWKRFHNPKDLALSISLEAAELLEVFHFCGLDMVEFVEEKIQRYDAKYSVVKAKDSAKKYDEL